MTCACCGFDVLPYRDLPDFDFAEAFEMSARDPAFFSHYFCRRILHPGQLRWQRNAEATINILATSNRWGKTAELAIRHLRHAVLKIGLEPRYVTADGTVDLEAFLRTPYKTIHTAGLWDTAKLVWDDCLKIIGESPRLDALVKATPRTLPPHIEFHNGSRIIFRTLGDHGEGIDGNSFPYVSIDEAGWITNLEEIIQNVARVRVADVRGKIDLTGTMKAGISRDFYRYARRAAISTGADINFEFKDGVDYAKEFGFA